jgi:hypothetical protein
MKPNGEQDSPQVVQLADRMQRAPMQPPHSTPPTMRRRSASEPEVVELNAVWRGGDRWLEGLREQARTVTAGLLQSGMLAEDATTDIMRAAALGAEVAVREHFERKVGND